MPAPQRTLAVLAAVALVPAGCDGGDEGEDPTRTAAEAAERPARPPSGWRTISNPVVGSTVAAPKSWPGTTSRQATLIRSDDQLVSITVAADRSAAGARLSPARYARRTIRSLTGFRGTVQRRVGRVRGSPYPNAVVDADGTVKSTSRPQRISVAVFRHDEVSYTAIVFRNARVKPRFNDRTIARVLRTVRAARRRP